MISEEMLKRAIIAIFSTVLFTGTGIAYAFEMCDMMNPSKMRGEHRDRHDYYGNPESGPGYGYGYGYGYRGRSHGYRGRGYHYGSPGYGYGGYPAPGYGNTARAYGGPQPRKDALQAEINYLKERIKNLEEALTHEPARLESAPMDAGTN